MSPRVALITGCSTGIGLSLAILLAKDPNKSFKVYATMRNLEKRVQLEETAGECLETTLFIEELDVCSDTSVTELVDTLIAREGRIDILVNNAGVMPVGIMELLPMDVVRNVFETNFFGSMRTMTAVIPHMKSHMEGHVVNISSVFGLMGCPFVEYYCASKFALEGFSEAMAPILEKFNIWVSVVEPGPVDTPMAQRVRELSDKLDFSQMQADNQSMKLYEQTTAKLHDDAVNLIQSSKEIAELIKTILQTKKPHFRYLTNDKYAPKVFESKFADMSGDSVVGNISQRFFAEKS